MQYQFKDVIYVPGKQMHTLDTFSLMSAVDQSDESLIDRDEISLYVASTIEALPVSDIRLQQIIQAQENDHLLQIEGVYTLLLAREV